MKLQCNECEKNFTRKIYPRRWKCDAQNAAATTPNLRTAGTDFAAATQNLPEGGVMKVRPQPQQSLDFTA